jgi:hypothetical protein
MVKLDRPTLVRVDWPESTDIASSCAVGLFGRSKDGDEGAVVVDRL